MTRPRPKRTRLATGIYADIYGIGIPVGGKEHRYPLGTPLEELRRTRRDLIESLPGRVRTRPGTLRADVARALATLPTGRYRETMRSLLDHWLSADLELDGQARAWGDTPRAAITAVLVKTQLATFASATKADGKTRRFAPKTVKELRRALGWVYTTLDGPDAANPTRGVRTTRVTYDDPRGLDYAIIARILAALPDRGRPQDGPAGGHRGKTQRPTVSLTKIRLRVMAFTGLHQAEVARIEPDHVDLRTRRLWIAARRKGAGSAGAWHRLTLPAIEALRDFVQAEAFGPFSVRSMARSWDLALQTARAKWSAEQAGKRHPAPWPVHADARAYDLRHSVGTAVYLETGDIRAAQAILRHQQLSTTLRYTHAGVSARAEKARQALEKKFAAVLPQPASTRSGKNAQKSPPTLKTVRPQPRARSRVKSRKIA